LVLKQIIEILERMFNVSIVMAGEKCFANRLKFGVVYFLTTKHFE
jgi:hypothetical protein